MARLKEHSPKAGAQALILAPTRELCIQLHKAVKELARYTDLRLAVLVGGDSMEAQFAELAANPDIILATPGLNLPGCCQLLQGTAECILHRPCCQAKADCTRMLAS